MKGGKNLEKEEKATSMMTTTCHACSCSPSPAICKTTVSRGNTGSNTRGGASFSGHSTVTCNACLIQVVSEFRKHMISLNQRRAKLRRQVADATRTKQQHKAQAEQRITHQRTLSKNKEKIKALKRDIVEKQKANAKRKKQVSLLREHLESLRDECEIKQAEKLARTFPTLIRRHESWYKAISEQLVAEQQEAMGTLLHVLPLELGYKKVKGAHHHHQQQKSSHSRSQGAQGERLSLRVCGLDVPMSVSQVKPLSTVREEQELGSALGYVLLLVDLTARILRCPVLHVTGLDQTNQTSGGVGGFLMGFGVSHSTIWQPKSYWQLIPSDATEELPLYVQQYHSSQTAQGATHKKNNSSGCEVAASEGTTQGSKSASASPSYSPLQAGMDVLKSEVMKSVKSVITSTGGSPSALSAVSSNRWLFDSVGGYGIGSRGKEERYTSLRKGLGLLQGSVGMLCGHAMTQHQQQPERQDHRFVFDNRKVPLALLAELCSKYAPVSFVDSTNTGPPMDFFNGSCYSHMEGSLIGMENSHMHAGSSTTGGLTFGKENGALGLDFSVIAKPPPFQEEHLEEWDVVDFPKVSKSTAVTSSRLKL